MRELIREGDYFSEERMRLRAPRLFHRYIGRFRDIPRKNPQNPPGIPQNPPGIPQNPPGIPQNAQKGPEMARKGPKLPQKEAGKELRELLLSALEESAGAEDEDEDEDEDEEDEEDEEGRQRVPDAAERELLRLEFTSHMYQRFLQGLDSDFDYSALEQEPCREPPELWRDLEDQYFDQEEPGPAPPLP
ncbi:coiled-coil domain-containing protein 97 [Lonchura striata]